MENKKMILYHGTKRFFEKPNLSKSRKNIDFGKGFYLTEDIDMAKAWACNKEISLVNVYSFDPHGLIIKEFELDHEWLEMIRNNRLEMNQDVLSTYDKFDILIGPTADDKLFSTLNSYLNDYYTAEETIAILNMMEYNYQIVLKSQNAVDRLCFQERINLTGTKEKEQIIQLQNKEQEGLEDRIALLLKDMRNHRTLHRKER